ncbi:MAG TPA: DsrE family protein [Burkholderiales bacterium]|nr:DsrE family protein [Burkholderiales bacterium]
MKAARVDLVLAISIVLGLAGCTIAAAADSRSSVAPDKVVYHINDTDGQATRAMQYISNHLEVNPKAKIVIVTHATGVDFLIRGAKTKNGNLYSIPLDELSLQGVRLEVCEITLRERQLSRDQFIPEATFVPSGVAEITRLQQREGYAYLRP